ncbi:MAG: AraC family transcriptional regulator [Sterolibacteriaceae bacterium]|uniref:AraC family transcriptional regulator n=1 Tax=Candidatus Methylophosphatis roskildensis TaxID=2899263 RepID=A0A9D7DVV2_9PROT|nr:AraC family transcriptional regulator [Candidatus Methylophosphatis roskildensis]
MSHDTLSDVLGTVRLRGAVFYYVSCREPWSAEGSGVREVAAAVTGAEHVIAYHMITKGDGWAAVSGLGPVRLATGDVVMFPQGDAHVMSSAPGLKPSHSDFDWVYAARNQPMPMPIAYHSGVEQPGASMPVDTADTILLCGFIACDLRPFNPLIAALPRVLHVPAAGAASWVASILDQAVAESRDPRAGSDVLLARISEMFFVDAVRRYIESLPEPATGWLAALRDRHVGKAIGLLHRRPAEHWTIDELGRQVGLSRSALHERFLEFIGQPPMQYLANWRMQRGAVLLRDGDATVATIAQEVGYDSEAAFARAFKRLVGQPPAAWRRAQRVSS